MWKGRKSDKGYGTLYTHTHENLKAHRYSYKLAFGPIPSGLLVLHKCDNPPCVNPNHLCLGTPLDNSKDMMLKGRAVQGDRHPQISISDKQLRIIRALLRLGKDPIEVGKRFTLTSTSLSRFHTNKSRSLTQPLRILKPAVEATNEEKLSWIRDNKGTLRQPMQELGMLGRAKDSDHWIKRVHESIAKRKLVVVSDVRFLNEANYLERHDGIIWRVIRPGVTSDGHVSETEGEFIKADYTISNDGDLQHLANQVCTALEVFKHDDHEPQKATSN